MSMFTALEMRKTRLLKALMLLILWRLQYSQAYGQICEAPANADFDREPIFWCRLHTNINITQGCATKVVEVIQPPWSHGRLVRYIAHQPNQRILNVEAFQFVGGVEKELSVTEVEPDSSQTSTAITLRTSVTKEPFLVRLIYEVENGVEYYVACDLTKDEFQDEDNKRYQLVKWSSGARSAKYIRSLKATFSLHESAHMTFADSPVKRTSDFEVKSVRNTSVASEQIRVTHSGNATNSKPGTIVFYFRGVTSRGSVGCPNSRSCEREADMIREKFVGDGLSKVVIGISIGVGLLVAIVAIGMWIACCKSLTKKKTRNMDNLPISLRHFAYDTGDDKPSGQLRQWARGKKNVGKIEYLAIDLSPGNKQQESEAEVEQADAKAHPKK
eukprot:TRINITY_DN475_c0_g1_i1.p1 TRINITY_DN475_c0_g1~~TRINITY_DN475_c0_g1_i1.p1  ORF type:complete len:386 (+),score=37.22 TRINITY_DN475_c0_g1_i1:262-1419(+)